MLAVHRIALFRLLLALVFVPVANGALAAFGFEDVSRLARELAGTPYKRASNLPKELHSLTYDQYRDLRFRPDRFQWRGTKLPFELAFYHQGMYYDQPVRINEIHGNAVREIRYSAELFDYGANKLDRAKLQGLGFAGFRVHFPVNASRQKDGYKDEVLSFLGASYFRALGRGQRYGASARALAVDTALPSGEEFPHFVEFWLERPEANAGQLTIHALLDSRRVTGAYTFVVQPGIETAIDVKARLFLREGVGKLGIAPLTSMFFFGENQHAPKEDYRPEVHDSDGLLVHSGTGEWIWRPLLNPKRLLVTSFITRAPKGFGLMQRDRNFARYEDLEARYDLRPAVWVQPKGDWGSGRVELVSIPSPDETNDNIVAYWVPDKPPQPGTPFDFEYRMLWQKDRETRPPLAWVTQTRRGHGYVRKQDDSIAFTIDYTGGNLSRLPPKSELESLVWAGPNGQILENVAHRNDAADGWRISLRVKRIDDKKPLELRATLREGGKEISETWSYIVPPA